MKYVVVILDGAAGWPLDELGGKTTLAGGSARRTSTRSRAPAASGLAQTVPAGEEPSSSAACTSILGYDPVADYVGRGAIEAASMGIELAPDEVALRLNTVTIDDGIMKSYACGHIATEESNAIISDIATALDDDTFKLYPGVAYRHILVVKGHPELLDTRLHAAARHLRQARRRAPAERAGRRAAARLHGARQAAAREQRHQPVPRARRQAAGHRRVAVLAGCRAARHGAVRREARRDARR